MATSLEHSGIDLYQQGGARNEGAYSPSGGAGEGAPSVDGNLSLHVPAHSACRGRYIGFTSQFTIYDTADSKSLIRSIIKEMGLDEKVYKPGWCRRVSRMQESSGFSGRLCQQQGGLRRRPCSQVPALRDIYQRYWERCRQADAMDFDDLLFYTFLLFRDHPEVLARYQDQFRYILVDEYQDTNFAQHSIVLQLAKNHQHVCVVGMMHRVSTPSVVPILTIFSTLRKYIPIRRSSSWSRITVPPRPLSARPTA